MLAQRLERAQHDRQSLALDGLADEDEPQRPLVGRHASGGARDLIAHDDPVGDHAVVPTEEALAGPGRGAGDGDPHVQAVEAPGSAGEVAEIVGQAVGRIAVEGSDERQPLEADGVPARQRDHRLVDVDHVVVAVAQLAAKRRRRRRCQRHVRHGAVRTQADRAAERDDVCRLHARLRACAPVQPHAEAVVGVKRRDDPRLVPGRRQLVGEGFDVARHPPGIRPRVRRDEGDPHRPNGSGAPSVRILADPKMAADLRVTPPAGAPDSSPRRG